MDNMYIEEKLTLTVELEISKCMDDRIIPHKINNIFNNISIFEDNSKSPFRNVLAAATEPGTSIEAIKNYIRYQVGRSGSSKIWKKKKEKDGKIFAQEVVEHIQELGNDSQQIVENVKTSISKTTNLDSYFNDPEKIKQLDKKIHLRLAQLYLGYLAREHTALLGFAEAEKEDKTNKLNQSKIIPNKPNRR